MRRIRIISLFALGFCLSLSCQKSASLPDIRLVSNKTEVVADRMTSEEAFSLNWSYGGPADNITRAFMQFAVDKEFLTPYVVNVTAVGTSYPVTYREIQKMQEFFGVSVGCTLSCRVLAEGENVTSVYSNKSKVNIKFGKWPEINVVYLTGDATPEGWTTSSLESNTMVAIEGKMYGKYTWTGHLASAPALFRFNLVAGDWFPAIVIKKESGKPMYADAWDETEYIQFSVESEGDYSIELDLTDLSNIGYKISPVAK